MAENPAGARDDLAATLALAQVPGIGSTRLRTLMHAFGGAAAALGARQQAIAGLPGFGPAAATAIRACTVEQGRAILEGLDRLGARALLPTDPDFPPLLAEIPDAPPVLFVWGDVTLLRQVAVAMVGSRNNTRYGEEAGRLLAGGVAGRAVVVSGMARGIDAIVHEAALDGGGGTVGVLGNGFGVIYPAANRALYERMVTHGCLVTELPPGERPHAGAFPRRNRLVSGLAAVTVVVEAAVNSGALITADCALDQGRTVLAVPGPITSATSVGCNKLIQQGAKPVLSPGDILEELGLPSFGGGGPNAPGVLGAADPGAGPHFSAARGIRRATPADLNPLQKSLWDTLQPEPRHVDLLVTAGGGDTALVLTALTELEMRGLVRQDPGMMFAVV